MLSFPLQKRWVLLAALVWMSHPHPREFYAECIQGKTCASRERLTGDWLGNRSWLEEHGISFNLNVANFYQGVASGGLDQRFAYSGHGDYVTNFQLGKLGFNEGLFLKLRVEHRFGENIDGTTGAFFPTALPTDLPVAENDQLFLTNVLFTQALSERFAIFFGKLDTLDGDPNAFAHGRGMSQFMNTAMVANPIALRTVPYATLGCGFTILGAEGEPLFSFTLLNAVDTAETDGFSELFAEGVALAAELRLPTRFFDLPGHQLFAGTWNSREFVELGQDPRIVLPNVPINQVDSSWSLYWNFDQYLFSDSDNPKSGWGVFGRAGLADAQSNPLEWFLSFGVGGNSPLVHRRDDTFGLGWFYSGTSDEIGPFLQAALGPIGDGQGVELFYNYAATPWLHITPDLQVLVPAQENAETALVVGVRAVMAL